MSEADPLLPNRRPLDVECLSREARRERKLPSCLSTVVTPSPTESVAQGRPVLRRWGRDWTEWESRKGQLCRFPRPCVSGSV